MRVEVCGSTVEERIVELAGRQRGQVARRQLLALGVSRESINRRIRRGFLHCLDRGVYSIGTVPNDPARVWMTAVLRFGPDAALSNRAGAAHWGFRPSSSPIVDLTLPTRRRPAANVRLHVADLPADEVTVHESIPITTVPRTLLDLAATLSDRELERAIGRAEELRLADPLSLPDLIARHPGRRGVARARRVLATLDAGLTLTRSELEDRFLAFIAETGLPAPIANLPIEAGGERFEADFAWPDARLIVELDGHAHHSSRLAFERDRRRDRTLATAGWRTIRITARQLELERPVLLADLESLIYTQPPRRRSSVGRALHS